MSSEKVRLSEAAFDGKFEVNMAKGVQFEWKRAGSDGHWVCARVCVRLCFVAYARGGEGGYEVEESCFLRLGIINSTRLATDHAGDCNRCRSC
jgi:hypothetical protein